VGYVRGSAGALAIYNGQDNWFTFGANAFDKMNFDNILDQPNNPDGLPCKAPASGIGLTPLTATNPVGGSHTVTATVTDIGGNPVAGVTVTFTVTSGPNAGQTGTGVTNASGQATFTYTDTGGAGTDTIVATFMDSTGGKHTSNTVTKIWDNTPPSCVLKGVIAGGIVIAVQDSDGGLAATAGGIFNTAPSPAGGIQLTVVGNANVNIPANPAGSTAESDVTALKIIPGVSSHVSLKVTDAAGNVTLCDPVLTGVLRDTGRPDVTFVTGLSRSEGQVHIYNGSPGVAELTVNVNGIAFRLHNLAANQQATLNVSAELAASNNRVVLVAGGRALGQATVLFADR